jgi:hypothetical protein
MRLAPPVASFSRGSHPQPVPPPDRKGDGVGAEYGTLVYINSTGAWSKIKSL